MKPKLTNSRKKVAISIDLGGTDLKSAVIDSMGKILHQHKIPSQSKESEEKILSRLIEAIDSEITWTKRNSLHILGIGLGIPGIVSSEKGIVYQSPHFPHWKNFLLLKKLQKNFSASFILDNDANMAALGESWKGGAKNIKNFIFLTLGTGIGGAIVINQKVFHGDSGFAGEVGHLVIDRNGLSCNCGGKGCLEMYASATGIFSELSQRKKPTSFTPETLFQLAKKGDSFSLKIYQKFGEALGVGIASIVNVLDIETILLGGGISAAYRFFSPFALTSLSKHTYSTTAKKIRLKKAKLGNNAGIIGAARAVFLNKSIF